MFGAAPYAQLRAFRQEQGLPLIAAYDRRGRALRLVAMALQPVENGAVRDVARRKRCAGLFYELQESKHRVWFYRQGH